MSSARFVGKTSNRACAERITLRRDRLHKEKLRSVKSSIDNSAPKTLRGKSQRRRRRTNPSKMTKKKERNNRIQRENDILIRRILDVDKKHQKLRKSEFYLDSKHMKLRSLNRRTRNEKLRRVTRDNEKILDRILNVRPQFDRTKWKLEEKQRQKILKRLKTPAYVKTSNASSSAEQKFEDTMMDDLTRRMKEFRPHTAVGGPRSSSNGLDKHSRPSTASARGGYSSSAFPEETVY